MRPSSRPSGNLAPLYQRWTPSVVAQLGEVAFVTALFFCNQALLQLLRTEKYTTLPREGKRRPSAGRIIHNMGTPTAHTLITYVKLSTTWGFLLTGFPPL